MRCCTCPAVVPVVRCWLPPSLARLVRSRLLGRLPGGRRLVVGRQLQPLAQTIAHGANGVILHHVRRFNDVRVEAVELDLPLCGGRPLFGIGHGYCSSEITCKTVWATHSPSADKLNSYPPATGKDSAENR